MSGTSLPQLQRQIAQARVRLYWQTWLNVLPCCWAALLVLAAAWLLLHPFLLGPSEAGLRWAILGGALAAGTVLALAVAWWRGPSRLEAALALDERFGLKERVTTALTLNEEQEKSPAGQALLTDVGHHLEKLNVSSRFPLQFNWRRTLVPMAAAVLALLAVFFEPNLRPLAAEDTDPNLLAKAKADAIEKALAEARKKLDEKKKEQPKSKALEELDLKMEQLFDKTDDPKNKDAHRKKVEEIQKLEQENDKLLKEAQTALQKKADLDQQFKDMEKLTSPKGKDGPARDMLDALNKGDRKRAEEELKKLQDQLANNKLSEEEMQKLAEQLEEMQKQAEQLAQLEKDLQKQLEEAKEAGELSKEQLEQLERQARRQQELKELAQDLMECRNCMGDGDCQSAAKKLGAAGGKLQQAAGQKGDLKKLMEQMDQKGQQAKSLQQNQKLLQEARLALCQNLGMGNQPGPGLGTGQKAGTGPRPSQKTDADFKEEQQQADTNQEGQFKVVGTGPVMAGTKTKIPSKELPGVFQQTAQEAQQAIERQPISLENAELLKGYYQNLSGQKE